MSEHSNMEGVDAKNIGQFKYSYELPHHWDLRKQFLLLHGKSIPLDRLICLSQVFINISFYNLKYSKDVMDLIEKLTATIEKPPVISFELEESVEDYDEDRDEEDDSQRRRKAPKNLKD